MKWTLITAFLAALIAIAFTIAPEKPDFIPFSDNNDAESETTVRFVGGDNNTMLTGHWNLPSKSDGEAPPVILLAHGLGLIQGKSLSPFVSAFQEAGYAVVTFDYATFGQSDGLPRHQIHPTNHVADIQAAIAMINEEGTKRGVDASRIGLWGTSLGGGHVLMAAINSDPSIRAVISQVPHIASALETIIVGMMNLPVTTGKSVVKYLAGLLKWSVSKVVLRKESYFPIVGEPGSAALMQNPGDTAGYLGILNPGGEVSGGWKNAATTESGMHILFYRPLSSLSRVNLPVLLIAVENDTLCPAKFVQAAKERIKNAELFVFPNLGHFDIYDGEPLKTMLSKQIDFFNKYLH
ncbi:unnamed protein product [Cylindrotheca closterium]|uniref:Serine aminopeptidase S33 domain-containing protein n=1 Tax=Cylindrotheca closterium TaxID=2856 RepID=A0AAD2JNZ5_9STRA|nr:unnamed protein product [Cylindrotheca closterium]